MKILETLSNQIETLFLGGNGFRQEGGQAIGIWLPSAKKLTKLDLRYNDIGGVGMEHLCDGLKDTNLRYLFVEGNQIGDQGAIAISNLLKNIDSKLEEVFLGANQVTAEGAISISSCLEDNKTVNKIYLEGNNIGIVGADAFSTALEELDGNTGLRNLFVDNNNIGKDGSKRLANALNSSTAIADSLLE
jgi:Ran GTPase-activating protein (RanGAP) involved in mRNA processing and transport